MNKEEYKLSIIIPVFNCENEIKHCIESIINRKYESEYEIIIINDGSKDKSLSVCEDLAQKYKNIICINQDNRGVSVARNEGIQNSKGKWCTFIDGDDCVEEDYIKNILKIIQECEKNGSNLAIFGFNKIENTIVQKNIYNDGIIEKKYFFKELCEQKLNSPWNKVFNMKIIKKNRICFPEKIKTSEDGIFMANYAKCLYGNVYTSNKVLYNYVKNGNGTVANPKCSYIGDLFKLYHILKDIDSRMKCNSKVDDVFIERLYFLVNNLLKDDKIKKSEVKKSLNKKRKILYSINCLNKKNKVKCILLKYKLFKIIKITI